jgi:diaminopimelate epimerase
MGAESIVLRTDRGLLTCVRESGRGVGEYGRTVGLGGSAVAEAMDTRCPSTAARRRAAWATPIALSSWKTCSHRCRGAGPCVERHPLFPAGTNVHFVQVLDADTSACASGERGGGVPLGSGSCCCAAVVNGIRRGLLDATVQVQCDGGTVGVHWAGEGGVVLTGSVEPVMQGCAYL